MRSKAAADWWVCGLHAPRIRGPVPRCEVEAVHRIAPVCGKLHPVARLGGTGTRLGVLSGHPAHSDRGECRAVRDDRGNLLQDRDAASDLAQRVGSERLGAVSSVEQERLAGRGGDQSFTQSVSLG